MPYNPTYAAQCHDIPCYVTGFDVVVTNPSGTEHVFTLDDDCGQVTNISMLSKILRKALADFLEANDLDASACGCCRDAVDAVFNLADKTMTIDIVGDTDPDTIQVVPPFAAG